MNGYIQNPTAAYAVGHIIQERIRDAQARGLARELRRSRGRTSRGTRLPKLGSVRLRRANGVPGSVS